MIVAQFRDAARLVVGAVVGFAHQKTAIDWHNPAMLSGYAKVWAVALLVALAAFLVAATTAATRSDPPAWPAPPSAWSAECSPWAPR